MLRKASTASCGKRAGAGVERTGPAIHDALPHHGHTMSHTFGIGYPAAGAGRARLSTHGIACRNKQTVTLASRGRQTRGDSESRAERVDPDPDLWPHATSP